MLLVGALLAVFLLPLPLSAALVGLALVADAAGKASTSSDVYSLKVGTSASASRRSRDARPSREDRDCDGGVVRVRVREIALRRVAVNDLNL